VSNPTTETLFTSADFYFQNDCDLPQALTWAQQVVEKGKEYWTYQLVARIAAKMNNCAVALPNAEKSMVLAKEAGYGVYQIKRIYVRFLWEVKSSSYPFVLSVLRIIFQLPEFLTSVKFSGEVSSGKFRYLLYISL
jgi:hypothetical protein